MKKYDASVSTTGSVLLFSFIETCRLRSNTSSFACLSLSSKTAISGVVVHSEGIAMTRAQAVFKHPCGSIIISRFDNAASLLRNTSCTLVPMFQKHSINAAVQSVAQEPGGNDAVPKRRAYAAQMLV